MKKFIKEFGDFIKRGNVLDMAVGVIVGGAFTAIVTALSNGILKPFINWIIWLCNGKNEGSLESIYTVLHGVTGADGNLDLANSIDKSRVRKTQRQRNHEGIEGEKTCKGRGTHQVRKTLGKENEGLSSGIRTRSVAAQGGS